jgi:hypothetical protein
VSDIKVCTDDNSSQSSDIVICTEDQTTITSDIKVCDDEVRTGTDVCDTAPELSLSGSTDPAIGDVYTAEGGVEPYFYTITSPGSINSSTGIITDLTYCQDYTITVRDACTRTARITTTHEFDALTLYDSNVVFDFDNPINNEQETECLFSVAQPQLGVPFVSGSNLCVPWESFFNNPNYFRFGDARNRNACNLTSPNASCVYSVENVVYGFHLGCGNLHEWTMTYDIFERCPCV